MRIGCCWCAAAGVCGILCTFAQAQPLESGDVLIGAHSAGLARIWRFREGQLHALATSTPNMAPLFVGDLVMDEQGRVIFIGSPCGGNSNAAGLFRADLTTGQMEQLYCFPYIVSSPAQLAPGLPPTATGFIWANALHVTRKLRISIDDDVQGGFPRAEFVQVYGLTILMTQGAATAPAYFQFDPATGTFEERYNIAHLTSARGPEVSLADGYVHLAGGHQVERVKPGLQLNLRANFEIGGNIITTSATLNLQEPSEVLLAGGVTLDDINIPNVTYICGQITDPNVPDEGGGFRALSGITNLGHLNGSLFVTSNSGASGAPYLWDLAPRAPHLNQICTYSASVQHSRTWPFFSPVEADNLAVDGSRILVTQGWQGRVLSVTRGAYQVLTSETQSPGGVMAFPPASPPITGAALVIRVDSPVNVLLTDTNGRRIGYDAAGVIVNDFAAGGAVLELHSSGHPRVYAIVNPSQGNYEVEAVGTANGSYTIRGYLADTGASQSGALQTYSGQTALGLHQHLGLHLIHPLGIGFAGPCYANCDASTTPPVLNVADFACFLQRFAAGDAVANCDGSTVAPILNIGDFSCFLQSFAAGCP